MKNRDIQAAWEYHNGTKHPNGALLNPQHRFGPSLRPLLFKLYKDVPAIPLPADLSDVEGRPALEAIAGNPAIGSRAILDLRMVARLLYFSAGITKYLEYPEPWGRTPFRAAACTGALYHIELYLVCGDLPELEAGIYHFDPQGFALRQLRKGDYRGALIRASGDEASVAKAQATLVLTDVPWRNAVKYQAREYRHAFWDSGTILANTLAVAAAHGLEARIVMGFTDADVSELLGLVDGEEFPLALVPVGEADGKVVVSAPVVEPLSLDIELYSNYELDFPAIRRAYTDSALDTAENVAEWRKSLPQIMRPEPAGKLIPLQPLENAPGKSIEKVINRRGSARAFAREAITFGQLSTALERSLGGLNADFLETPDAALNDAYLIVHAVDGLEPGAYVYHREQKALELLKAGNFRDEAGYLGLYQDLAGDASVDVYFMADLRPILTSLGNRGYRAAQMEASIAAGRLYLAAYALGFGATGLTFFDDAITQFFAPHAAGKSAMFLIAMGKKGRERRAQE